MVVWNRLLVMRQNAAMYNCLHLLFESMGEKMPSSDFLMFQEKEKCQRRMFPFLNVAGFNFHLLG